jgi:3-oxoacyl-[acyl-carrier-protein] synthase II
MSVRIAGMGWVTPLGSDVTEVWDRLIKKDRPQTEEICDSLGKQSYPVYRVPQTALKALSPHPRLRRASAISRFTAAAGLAALRQAGLTNGENQSRRFALVLGVANGGVIYTKRFYDDIVKTGAETVFNAAASHLAAIIGLSGTTYTLVGDGSVGLSAIKMGEDLMDDQELDYCLVVAAEEADWLLCDAYQKWRLLRARPPLELFGRHHKGTILSEGAGAVLLNRTGPIGIAATSAGTSFAKRKDAAAALAKALVQVSTPANAIIIGSANGTFIDSAETEALAQAVPGGVLYSPKEALGEGVAATGLWQLIVAAQALLTGKLPAPQYSSRSPANPERPIELADCRQITVLSCGLNQQVGATRLVAEP